MVAGLMKQKNNTFAASCWYSYSAGSHSASVPNPSSVSSARVM